MADVEVITAKQAQRDHEALRGTKASGAQHQADSWKECAACQRRLRSAKVRVIE